MAKTNIMIVEDEIIVAKALRKELEDLGYGVCQVTSSGKEALEIAENEKPDLVIMDIRLHGEMDGIEAAGEIKDRFGIPAIFVTGYSKDEMKERFGVVGSIGHVEKPWSRDKLKSSIETALQKHNPKH